MQPRNASNACWVAGLERRVGGGGRGGLPLVGGDAGVRNGVGRSAVMKEVNAVGDAPERRRLATGFRLAEPATN